MFCFRPQMRPKTRIRVMIDIIAARDDRSSRLQVDPHSLKDGKELEEIFGLERSFRNINLISEIDKHLPVVPNLHILLHNDVKDRQWSTVDKMEANDGEKTMFFRLNGEGFTWFMPCRELRVTQSGITREY
jgi:hypothetical protein